MLDLRSAWIAGRWETFRRRRIERDREHRYPYREQVAGEAFFARAPWRTSGYALLPGAGVTARPLEVIGSAGRSCPHRRFGLQLRGGGAYTASGCCW